ncbi:GNAT family N-acetyltransferase [Kitasatospora cheerisanensis]|uniref:Putative acetyltransferase n=1 Tax=Kitasatospora cheerisanensis KCTC 2395 TaxID=1348663 RepID=A0A066YUW3_9ACTN|nr:GNAT family N-acetyltransferase [Kitasatospora cheerisanensis]KDN83759.1 putative acetyltransferase [Kitasatospora cheerisanensis KCTC 2395]
MRIRTGGPDSAPDLLRLIDGAVAWLAAQGRTGQWGSVPWSQRPESVARAEQACREQLVRVAERAAGGGDALGVCVLAEDAPSYAPPVPERELYVRWLVTDRVHSGSGIGAALVADALRVARGRGIGLLRVDCYAGGDGRLVEQYERLGFTRTATFTVDRPTGPWPGQVLEQRVGADSD